MSSIFGEIFGAMLCLLLLAPVVIIIAGMLVRFDIDNDGKDDI
jgi:hypothetical protein